MRENEKHKGEQRDMTEKSFKKFIKQQNDDIYAIELLSSDEGLLGTYQNAETWGQSDVMMWAVVTAAKNLGIINK